MKISNELLAAYAEGNVSSEERIQVRQYLSENPAELESVMMMMDEDYELEPYADDDNSSLHINIGNIGHTDKMSFSDIALSAAAFAPACNMENNVMQKASIIETHRHSDKSSFSCQIGSLLNELGF